MTSRASSPTQFVSQQFYNFTSLVNRSAKLVYIVAVEAYATARYVVPASITWVWRKYVLNEIQTITLQVTAGNTTKVAYLNIHSPLSLIRRDQNVVPILLGHGDYGHPYTMLHLADIAKKEGSFVFSLYIPDIQDTPQFDLHNELTKKAIDKIQVLTELRGNFRGLLGAAHSKASLLFAQRQFVDLDPRINATLAVGGRLRISDENSLDDEPLKRVVRRVYQGILENPKKPVVQIVPEEDWCSPQESMKVRIYDHCHSVPGMHLSGLFKDEARSYFSRFVRDFSHQNT